VDNFSAKHVGEMQGVISRFDRLVFRGTLRAIRYAEGIKAYLTRKGIWVGDFAQHVQRVSERLKRVPWLRRGNWGARFCTWRRAKLTRTRRGYEFSS
jgi:hypothetical protein